jgi:hypothetical protein
MSGPLITALIEGKDNIEVIRDQIAAILSLELQNQKKMAEEAGREDPAQYDVRVFVENSRPYEMRDRKSPVRLMNVVLPKANLVSGSRAGSQKETAVFWIDCAAAGNGAASQWNEKSAVCRAWAVCRLARNILMSDAYLYLGLRGVAGSRAVTAMEAGMPQSGDMGEAVQFAAVRLTLEVQFAERYIEREGPPVEGIDFEITPAEGELVANGNQDLQEE